MKKMKCIIILSYKSSGSTALQSILSQEGGINTSSYTEHVYNETLFWSKAASILNLPQDDMYNSQTPIPRHHALNSLENFINKNTGFKIPQNCNKQTIFKCWEKMCKKYGPVFLEKSPHHLYQESVLELINECIIQYDDEIDFLLVGLIRNPMAMVYSDYNLRNSDPSISQYVWNQSYNNLLKIRSIHNDRLVILKYEDMINNLSVLDSIIEYTGLNNISLSKDYFHKESLDKWSKDNCFSFSLSEEVIKTAQKFGYTESELIR